jgi:twitching motility protein PilT
MELPVVDQWAPVSVDPLFTSEQGRPDLALDLILGEAVARRASDIHLRVGKPPLARIGGALQPLNFPVVDADWAADCVHNSLGTPEAQADYVARGDHDFALHVPGVGRFRVNAYRSRGLDSMVLRHVREQIPTLEELGLPATARQGALAASGLVLICGPTGSGKSTTLAAMVGLINAERAFHILTIEDPIEFLHADQLSSVSQREVRIDTSDFASALRSGLRQDPDVIVIGEIRDLETMSIALQAAETGHLVLASIHAASVVDAVQRAIDLFPQEEQVHARNVLAEVLQCVISQRLVASSTPDKRSLLLEIAVTTPRVKQAISNPEKTSQLFEIMQEGDFYGMFTLQQDAVRRVLAGDVSLESAESVITSMSDFRLSLKQSGYRGLHE